MFGEERAPRVTRSLTAESPTIGSLKTSLVSIQGFSPPVSCVQGRLVKIEIHSTEGQEQLLWRGPYYGSSMHVRKGLNRVSLPDGLVLKLELVDVP
jgi:hypothetical protein